MLCKPIHCREDPSPKGHFPCSLPMPNTCNYSAWLLLWAKPPAPFSSSFLGSTLLKAAMTSRCMRAGNHSHECNAWLPRFGVVLGWGREGSGKMHGMCFASESLCQVKESLFRHLLVHARLLGVPHHRCKVPTVLPSPVFCLFRQRDSSAWQENLLQPLVTRHQRKDTFKNQQNWSFLGTRVVLSARLGGTRWDICTVRAQ